MGARSERLADQFEEAVGRLLAIVEESTPEQWAASCADGDWTQGFAAYHAAFAIETIAQAVNGVADGGPFAKMTMAQIDEINAEQARAHGDCTAAETAGEIRRAAPAAAGLLRSLSDDQLDIKVQLMDGMPEVTLEMMVQLAMVGHLAVHTATITGAR
jgi:hypothetical protein